MSARRNDALPQSGVAGVHWHAPLGKWAVRFKVNGREFYYGVFADLDEAKRVCAAARLEHDPKPRAREDSTTHLTDAEIAERFALDDEDDPVWREKPLEGDEATIRDNARWNRRHGGKKLDERAGFLRDGRVKLMWRKDIVQRLIAIAEMQRGGNPQEAVATAESTPPEAVATDCTQGSGNPHEAVAIVETQEDPRDDGAAPSGGADVAFAAGRDDEPAAADGEILPPEPIGKGALARVIVAAARSIGARLDELTVLSSGKDPYRVDTPLGHTLGRWLRANLDRLAPGRRIHLRGVHYLLIAARAKKPDGSNYQNIADDYRWLNDRVAKAARWLRYVDFERIVDERNEEPLICRALRSLMSPAPGAGVLNGYVAVDLPEKLTIRLAKPFARLTGFSSEQRFSFVVFGEKSSLAEVLEPFAQRHGADLYIATGELSDTRARRMARDAASDGRKLICICFSDFDPSGVQMPVSIARKLMAQRDLFFPCFEFVVVPAALTLEQVIALRLPPAMVEKNDRRRGRWQETFAPPLIAAGLLRDEAAPGDEGKLAQIEIDALAALRPNDLNRIAEETIAPFLDATLAARAGETAAGWTREAEAALRNGVDQAALTRLSRVQARAARRFNTLLKGLRAAKRRLDSAEAGLSALVAAVALPDVPAAPEAEERSEDANPLIDSDWGFIRMSEALKERKKYDDDVADIEENDRP